MGFETIIEHILTYGLPTGFLGAVVTWFVTKRKRNNDFLAELQKSIDMLSKEYTKVLGENVQLKSDKADLLAEKVELIANQAILERKVDALTRSVNELRKQLKLENNEKSNSMVGTVGPRIRNTVGLLPDKTDSASIVRSRGVSNKPRAHLRDSSSGRDRIQCSDIGTDARRIDDSTTGDNRGHSGGGSTDDDTDQEPARPARRGAIQRP